MTVADANSFLRYLVQPVTAADRTMHEAATTLFRRVTGGDEIITTTDAVIAEIVFILSSKRHDNLSRPEVVPLLRPLLSLPGCALPDKYRCLAALDLWATRPRLSFVDGLVAVQAGELGQPVASFNGELAKVPGVTLWEPPTGDEPRDRDEGRDAAPAQSVRPDTQRPAIARPFTTAVLRHYL